MVRDDFVSEGDPGEVKELIDRVPAFVRDRSGTGRFLEDEIAEPSAFRVNVTRPRIREITGDEEIVSVSEILGRRLQIIRQDDDDPVVRKDREIESRFAVALGAFKLHIFPF